MVVIKSYKVILPLSVVPIQNHIAGHTSQYIASDRIIPQLVEIHSCYPFGIRIFH